MIDDNSIKIGSDTITPARECGPGCKRFVKIDGNSERGRCEFEFTTPRPPWKAPVTTCRVLIGQFRDCPAFVPVTVEGGK